MRRAHGQNFSRKFSVSTFKAKFQLAKTKERLHWARRSRRLPWLSHCRSGFRKRNQNRSLRFLPFRMLGWRHWNFPNNRQSRHRFHCWRPQVTIRSTEPSGNRCSWFLALIQREKCRCLVHTSGRPWNQSSWLHTQPNLHGRISPSRKRQGNLPQIPLIHQRTNRQEAWRGYKRIADLRDVHRIEISSK